MNRISALFRVFGSIFSQNDEVRPPAYPLDQADYQRRPLSDKPALRAAEIPKAFTPEGGYKNVFPAAILVECDEALAPDAPDLRGVWVCTSGKMKGHVERIEQAGNRVCITAGGVIHDMFVDGTVENGVNDINLKTGAEIRVAADFKNGELRLRPGGKRLVVVNRYLDGDDLIWRYGPFRNRLVRLTEPLPEWLPEVVNSKRSASRR